MVLNFNGVGSMRQEVTHLTYKHKSHDSENSYNRPSNFFTFLTYSFAKDSTSSLFV